MELNYYDMILAGKRIQQARKAKGYTQEVLSEIIMMSSKNLSCLERGTTGLSLSTLVALSRVLEVSTDYILFGTKNEDFDCTVSALLRQCPPEKLCYIEDIIKLYIQATEQNS